MCLAHAAHGVESQHEIFQGPFPVELQWEHEDTPSNYRRYYLGRNLPDTLPTWRVQTTGYLDDPSQSPGVVASGWGFDDSPDAEVIAGGLNAKGPNAVALGRHGPLFHWGFYAEPKDMTPSGRAAFLNAVAYTAKFDRTPLLVRAERRHRGWALDMASFTADLAGNYADYLKSTETTNAKAEAAREVRDAGERELTASEQIYVDFPVREAQSWEEYRSGHFERGHSAAVVEQLGTERPEAYLEYYLENLDWLVPASDERYSNWVVDEDARAFGFANHDLRLLHAAIDALGLDEESQARGIRVLKRYTDRDFATPQQWRAWLDSVQDRLFFSDVGGYRWFLRPSESPNSGY